MTHKAIITFEQVDEESVNGSVQFAIDTSLEYGITQDFSDTVAGILYCLRYEPELLMSYGEIYQRGMEDTTVQPDLFSGIDMESKN